MNLSKVKDRINKVREHGWQTLDLRNCGLTIIPPEIFQFENLVSLDIGNDPLSDDEFKNKIKEIPEDISNLKRLTRLNLEGNQIREIPESLSELRNLKYLNLSNNELTDIPEKVANMSCLTSLHVDNNPFEMLPPEITARGIDSIRNFFKELEEKDYLYEVKLIVVGEGRVGKTCITQALIQDNFRLEDTVSTEGININAWVIPQSEIIKYNPKIQRDLQINIWDFGGQEIYHSTHQFFLTKRSIYLLVTESRKEDSHDDFFYWLNIIKILGEKSPVVMILNKCDQPTKELPIKEYREHFSNIIDFRKLSLKTGYESTLASFKDKLKDIAANLSHIGNPLPKVWVDIRREIEELKLSGINYISQENYFEICKKHYRKEESAKFLSEYFHDLGVLLHFQDDIELRDVVFLNNEWITKGVYKILDDRQVISQKGKFTLQDIERIWQNEEHKPKTRELLSLMKNRKFDLCFELSDGNYLVPRLLPVDEIDHGWVSNSENLRFEIHYKFMPKGILARLIVKLSNDIFEDKYWRYGVIVQYERTQAIIKEKYFESKITIELSGNHKREFLFIIRKAIKDINNDFNRLQIKEMAPCKCAQCRSIENPYFFDFELLKRYELKGLAKIRCDLSLDEVSIFDLTSDMVKGQLSSDRLVFCENETADLLTSMNLEKLIFYPEKDSASVFIKIKTKPDSYGLRDRDFLLDSEIEKLRKNHPNYFILEYYCIENYLFHPDNIHELRLNGFKKDDYISEIIRQKNFNKNKIISIYRNSRNTYQEFKIEKEKIRSKAEEDLIMGYLESNELETFLKAYSMKDHFDKNVLKKYSLTQKELANTEWFKRRIYKILRF